MAKPKNVAWMFAAALVTALPALAQDWPSHGPNYYNPKHDWTNQGRRGGFQPDAHCPSGYVA